MFLKYGRWLKQNRKASKNKISTRPPILFSVRTTISMVEIIRSFSVVRLHFFGPRALLLLCSIFDWTWFNISMPFIFFEWSKNPGVRFLTWKSGLNSGEINIIWKHVLYGEFIVNFQIKIVYEIEKKQQNQRNF